MMSNSRIAPAIVVPVINMNFGGWQKTSLLDYPDKIATVLFTSGCPFRCAYSHHPDLASPPFKGQVDEDETLEYLKKRTDLIEGVVISGGEPAVHKDLLPFIHKVKHLRYAIKLDTCGFSLKELNSYSQLLITLPWISKLHFPYTQA